MNLAEIREDVAAELKFKPGSSKYETRLTRRINRIYRELMTRHRWSFLLGETAGLFMTTAAVVADVTNGSYIVSIPAGANNLWVGHKFHGPDGENYTIGSVDPIGLRLLAPYAGVTAAGASASIFFERYRLQISGSPLFHVLDVIMRRRDTLSPPTIGTTGYGKLKHVSSAEEAGIVLNQQYTGVPTHYMLEHSGQTVGTMTQMDISSRPFSGAAIAGGSLTSGKKYRYIYIIEDEEPSPRSGIVEVTPSGANLTVKLSVQANPTGHGAAYSFYRDDGDGIFRLLGKNSSDVAYFIDDGTATPGARYFDLSTFEYLKVWPIPDEDMNMSIRYVERVVDLQHDLDVPRMPAEYHMVLVHMAVEELAANADGGVLSKFHGSKADAYIQRMRRRFLTRTAAIGQRGMWDPAGGRSHNIIQQKITIS